MEENISMLDFFTEFRKRRSWNGNAAALLESNLIFLFPDERWLDFAYFLEEIDWTCEEFEGDQENAENIFRNSINKTFLKIQNHLNLK